MSAQDIILGARVAHIRELKVEIEKLKSENARLHDENAALLAHLDFALIAAQDLRGLSPDGRFILIDGWNLVLGSQKRAKDPAALIAQAKAHLKERPLDFIWIVFDGPKANSKTEDRLRVSYTGGTGPHRADKFICDFVRMAGYLGLSERVEVQTCDKEFLARVKRLLKS